MVRIFCPVLKSVSCQLSVSESAASGLDLEKNSREQISSERKFIKGNIFEWKKIEAILLMCPGNT